MKQLTASELLEIWENGWQQSALNNALHLLHKAYNTPNIQAITQLSIGERDARLLELRTILFGQRLMNKAKCPKCTESVEWEMDTSDIQLQKPQLSAEPKIFNLQTATYSLRFRLPNSQDMLNKNALATRQILLNCILDVKNEEKDCSKEEITEGSLETLAQQMEKEDPQANITMALNCPACHHNWTAVFDILTYLWAEIDNWAKHLVQEIYILARAFGWSERDILNMSVRRRQMYINMLKS